MRRLPAYFDRLIAAYRAGQTGRDVHLGYWERPPGNEPVRAGELSAAQRRFTERAVAAAAVPPGARVLDIGCGFGGTLAALAAIPDTHLVGVNIDPRQIDLCRTVASPGGRIDLVAADAGALAFVTCSFDRVFCLEAMFHFRSRRLFLAEAARVLRPGGLLVVTDILLRDPGVGTPWNRRTIEIVLQQQYGPWPELWLEEPQLRHWAAEAGCELVTAEDWTANTLPSYRTIAPPGAPALHRRPDAGSVLCWLHHGGWLRYPLLVFRRAALERRGMSPGGPSLRCA